MEGLSVEEAVTQKKVPFLKAGKLSHQHKYYYWIQGQLGVTGLKWCDSAVDSSRDIFWANYVWPENVEGHASSAGAILPSAYAAQWK